MMSKVVVVVFESCAKESFCLQKFKVTTHLHKYMLAASP